MHDDPVFFRQRAMVEQANADAAELENVRLRCQRAADSWGKMADRAELTRAMQATRMAASVSRADAASGGDADDAGPAAMVPPAQPN